MKNVSRVKFPALAWIFFLGRSYKIDKIIIDWRTNATSQNTNFLLSQYCAINSQSQVISNPLIARLQICQQATGKQTIAS
jgi:hypothetical protein